VSSRENLRPSVRASVESAILSKWSAAAFAGVPDIGRDATGEVVPAPEKAPPMPVEKTAAPVSGAFENDRFDRFLEWVAALCGVFLR
jgi:hypothetical protein